MRRFDAIGCAALAAVCLLGASACQSSRGWQVAEDSEWREGGPRESEPLPPPGTASSPGLETVYFDFDAWNLDAATLAALEENARAIAEHPDWGALTVEGHCDERGSEEYNLALGMRRAENVVGYLRDLGVPDRRLRTVSFGEARPAVTGSSESAWRWNRRSAFRSANRTAAR